MTRSLSSFVSMPQPTCPVYLQIMELTPPSPATATAFTRATAAATSLRSALPEPLQQPHVAIVCGSGLGGLQHALLPNEPKVEVSYDKVPGMPKLTGRFCGAIGRMRA